MHPVFWVPTPTDLMGLFKIYLSIYFYCRYVITLVSIINKLKLNSKINISIFFIKYLPTKYKYI